jgi:hypothetical protein
VLLVDVALVVLVVSEDPSAAARLIAPVKVAETANDMIVPVIAFCLLIEISSVDFVPSNVS